MTAGVLVASYVLRDHPDPKSVDQALDEFRRNSGSSVPQALSGRRPAAGVYEMQGTGWEKISFPPNSQADGTTMPVSIEHLSGECFRWRVDYNEAHWQQQEMCRDGDDLLLKAVRNFQRWDFGSVKVENTGDFTCDPAERYPIGAEIGTVTTGSCTGVNTAQTGQTTITSRTEVVEREQLRVGDAMVDTVHLRQRQDATGAQKGEEALDWWFEVRTALPVRIERAYRFETESPIGAITYTEEGQAQLTDVEPRR